MCLVCLSLLIVAHAASQTAASRDDVSPSYLQNCTGFKQGDVNAPMLFNLFLDTALRYMQPEMLQLGLPHYRVDGVLRDMPSRNIPDVFWSILFADDMAIVVPSAGHTQTALQVADDAFSRWGLKLSLKRTKVMAAGCSDPMPAHFSILRGDTETVVCFKYLGSYLAQDGGIGLEVLHRIKAAAFAFHRLRSLWMDRDVKEHVKLRVYQTII